MSEIIKCDRCGKSIETVEGFVMTSGYYNVTGYPWKIFAKNGEQKVCDECIHNSMEYKRMVG